MNNDEEVQKMIEKCEDLYRRIEEFKKKFYQNIMIKVKK